MNSLYFKFRENFKERNFKEAKKYYNECIESNEIINIESLVLLFEYAFLDGDLESMRILYYITYKDIPLHIYLNFYELFEIGIWKFIDGIHFDGDVNCYNRPLMDALKWLFQLGRSKNIFNTSREDLINKYKDQLITYCMVDVFKKFIDSLY